MHDRHNGSPAPKAAMFRHGVVIPLEEVLRQAILSALEQANWIQVDAAKLLHISPRALQYKLRKLGLSEQCRLKRRQARATNPEPPQAFPNGIILGEE